MSFGIKTKELQGGYIPNASCTSCNTAALRNIGTIKLFHIWWIPMFPFWASAKVKCAACQNIIKLRNASEDVRHKANSVITLKAIFKSCWGLWLAIVTLIVMYIFGTFLLQEKREFVMAPQVGDIYVAKIDEFVIGKAEKDSRYGIFKVVGVNGEKIKLIVSGKTYSDMKGVRNAIISDSKQAEFYSNVQLDSDVTVLMSKFEAGRFEDVQR